MDKVGVEDLKKALLFACELANVIDKMSSDGSPILGKLGHIMMLSDELMMLPSLKLSNIGQQVKDLDGAELAELQAALKEKLDLADDKLEVVIEGGVGILVKVAALVEEGKALVGSLKK